MVVDVKMKRLHNGAVLPFYAHTGDAGFDLCACQPYTIPAGQKVLVSTGIAMAIPQGHVGLIWDRSGLAASHSLHALAGVVDSGYRGEVKIVLMNLGKEEFAIEKGMRVAQMLIQQVSHAQISESHELEETVRNTGGFGSTGY